MFMSRLGLLYEQGLGVEQDVEKAITLYKEAAEYDNGEAIAALVRLGVTE
jgi:TPR repeat protein